MDAAKTAKVISGAALVFAAGYVLVKNFLKTGDVKPPKKEPTEKTEETKEEETPATTESTTAASEYEEAIQKFFADKTVFNDTDSGKYGPLHIDQATTRKAVISNVTYNVVFCLRRKNYLGSLKATFDLESVKEGSVFFDFTGKAIYSLKVNDTNVSKNTWAAHKLMIPAEHLKEGANVVEIKYLNIYDNAGFGFHSFVDPLDDQQYIFSDFEPFYAHRLFPCFDQPNLKAPLKLRVVAPKEWKVIANELNEKEIPLASAISSEVGFADIIGLINVDDYNFHEFKETPKLSPYLYALIAGPYHEFTCDKFRVPMKIFCRKSLEKYARPDDMFNMTIAGMEVYERFFGYDFPFSKYDQIFVPEYNMGAMENPGAVTFNEAYIWKDAPTQGQKSRFAITVLHELAHMWFGDLVTMDWWADLWLNESFATYVSHLALEAVCANVEEFAAYTDSWDILFKYKEWGYREDQLSTTHPIATEVNTTEEAIANFDGITYAKGAASLKQLVFMISERVFSEGLKTYFSKYEWGNTTRDQFIGEINDACKDAGLELDLFAWADEHLKTAGLNEVEPIVEWSEDGEITDFKIKQTVALKEHPTLRRHKLLAVLYNKDVEEYEKKEITVEAQEITEIPELKGEKPAAVFINGGDQAFVKTLLDAKSSRFFKENLSKVEYVLHRTLIMRVYADMVRDRRLASPELLEVLEKNLPKETNGNLLQSMLGYAQVSVSLFTPAEHVPAQREKLFNLIWDVLPTAEEKDIKINLFNALITFAKTKEQLDKILVWVDDKPAIEDFTVSLANKWAILTSVFASTEFNQQEKEKRLQAMIELDSSDIGKREEQKCRAALPSAAVKQEYWDQFSDASNSDSNYLLRAKMSGFLQPSQRELLEPFAQKFFAEYLSVVRSRSKEFTKAYFQCLLPSYLDNDELQDFLKKLIEEFSAAEDSGLQRLAKEQLDDLIRRREAQKLTGEYLSQAEQASAHVSMH